MKEKEVPEGSSPLTVIGGNLSFSLSDEGIEGSSGLSGNLHKKEESKIKVKDTRQGAGSQGNQVNQLK
mgnify:CR=1 FL=1